MIRYALKCAEGHVSESWFQSAEAYEKLARAGQLVCAVCGDRRVEKALMAPSVPAGSIAAEAPAPTPAAEDAPAPMLSAPSHPMEAALKALRAKVEANADDVGRDFPRIARAMHEGEIEHRPVYGEATGREARELSEDGVPVAPLPWFARRND